MRRIVDFVVASILAAAGSIKLTFLLLQLVSGGEFHALGILSASLMLWVGAYWLWTDFLAVPERER
jgi:hypothetical protein